ncbi:PREDICTED: haloacid dehalogenase-like hydrolase domain-containing protein At3g48420 [Tarenaya hassleriana]|uniref:haloacid dehalogenase-like hydrolase domain-containing protein At3g48420 n=1 Tax=Tarenaya hassleriana TaxID=28532 RepID=UPI00053C5263|nr:PREDICTED: haloacid dehalogenase-like hydrolase domain-containing protein At3g48420 [Tarenaya hassleriana]
METASGLILNNLQLSCARAPLFPRRYVGTATGSSLPSASAFSGKSKIPGKCLRLRGLTAFSSPLDREDLNPSDELAVILEVDGVMIDAYRSCNRQAFNVAFQKLGLDCANWPEPVYSDLLRKGAGDEERMLTLYFNRIGWPTSLPTSEKGNFVKSVMREKKNAMGELLMSESLPLRSGIKEFIDNACKEGMPVVIVTAYFKSGDKVARSIVEKLGQERVLNVKVIGNDEVEQSLYGQLVLGKGVSSSLEDQLVKEAKKAASAEKQRVAEEVASMLKLSVELDASSSESFEKIVVALRAAAEYAGLPVDNCVLVAGSQSGVAAAKMIGMSCIVMRSSLTSRGEFPSAKAVMDGFGGADLTIQKLRNKLKS